VVAVGALAVCAVAGGAVIHTRSSGPPEAGPAEDVASLPARIAAWTHEAAPVLAAIESEFGRADELRRRWDESSLARSAGPPPRAVTGLLERRDALAQHRDGLRATMTAIRAAPTSESAWAPAWPRLRAAQAMLGALASGRGELGDPVEAAVLRLLAEDAAGPTVSRSPGEGKVLTRGLEDSATVVLAVSTSEVAGTRIVPATVSRAVADPTEAVVATRAALAGGPADAIAPSEPTPRSVATAASRSAAPSGDTDRASGSPDAEGGEAGAAPERARRAPEPTATTAPDGSGPDESGPDPESGPDESGPDESGTEEEDDDDRPAADAAPAASRPTMLTFDRPSTPDPAPAGDRPGSHAAGGAHDGDRRADVVVGTS
jgi:hypothetical protein